MSASSPLTAKGRRRGPGRPWQPGTSGNPHGRPPAECDIAAMCRQHGPAAVDMLAAMAGLIPGERAESESTRLAAVKELLDRGFGRPTQILGGDDERGPIAIEFTWAPATPQPEPRTALDIEGTPDEDSADDVGCLAWNAC